MKLVDMTEVIVACKEDPIGINIVGMHALVWDLIVQLINSILPGLMMNFAILSSTLLVAFSIMEIVAFKRGQIGTNIVEINALAGILSRPKLLEVVD